MALEVFFRSERGYIYIVDRRGDDGPDLLLTCQQADAGEVPLSPAVRVDPIPPDLMPTFGRREPAASLVIDTSELPPAEIRLNQGQFMRQAVEALESGDSVVEMVPDVIESWGLQAVDDKQHWSEPSAEELSRLRAAEAAAAEEAQEREQAEADERRRHEEKLRRKAEKQKEEEQQKKTMRARFTTRG